MNVLLRVLLPAIEAELLACLIAAFHYQFWPDDLTDAQSARLKRANIWLMILMPFFAFAFNWRIDLPLPYLGSP
jgi:hypothetical protein